MENVERLHHRLRVGGFEMSTRPCVAFIEKSLSLNALYYACAYQASPGKTIQWSGRPRFWLTPQHKKAPEVSPRRYNSEKRLQK